MREVIGNLLQPVVEMSSRDREGMLILESTSQTQTQRLELLEMAVFNKSVNKKKTLFEQMQEQIKINEIYMKEKCKKMDDKINEKIKEIDDTMFLHN